MFHYRPPLVTLDYVRQHRRLASEENKDDDLLLALIQESSADFVQGLMDRIPMPYRASKAFSARQVWGSDLKLRDDLLEVEAITNAGGGSITPGQYNLRPDNLYPKHTVELLSNGGTWWDIAYREDRVTISGVWGYVPHYTHCWKAHTTLSANVTDTTTRTISLASTNGISVGHYLRIGNETLGYVTGVTGLTVTVDERGALGTSAATAASGVMVSVFQQLPDIMKAVREMVVYAYTSKDKIGGTTRIYENGVMVVEDISPDVETTRRRHMRKQFPSGV
jgi:F0F1-type ATP synthase, beta subunit